MNIRYRVDLSQTEREQLAALLSGGTHPARKIKRAQILLAADAGVGDEAIAASVLASGSTVYRTKRRFVEGNLEAALSEEPRPGAARKMSGQEEAMLVATACAKPPKGRARWTLTLLAGEMVRLTGHDALSRETVRRRLAENALKPWRKDMWCIPQVDGAFVAGMEDGLDLDAEAPDPKRPVVCFDESPTQLIGEVRQPIPPAPGQLERYDYEYRRNGTANLFIFLDAHQPWRAVKVTDRRTAQDFAECMRPLAATTTKPRSTRQNLRAEVLGLLRPPVRHLELAAKLIHREPFVLAVPQDDPLRHRPQLLGIRALHGHQFVMYSPDEAQFFFELLTGLFQQSKVMPDIVQHAGTPYAILALVGVGLGAALVPASAQRFPAAGVAFVPIALTSRASIDFLVAWRRSNDNPALPPLLSTIYRLAGDGSLEAAGSSTSDQGPTTD